MMQWALSYGGPVAIRYPKGEACIDFAGQQTPIELGVCETLHPGKEVCLLALGSMVKTGEEVCEILGAQGIRAGLINLRFAKPLDWNGIRKTAEDYPLLVVMEENETTGGIGQQIRAFCQEEGLPTKIRSFSLPDCFISHGSTARILQEYGLTAEQIAAELKDEIQIETEL